MKYANLCRCKSCDAINGEAPHGAKFENSFAIRRFCPFCGLSDGWYDSTEFWTSTAVALKPWTWGSGYWTKKAGAQ